MKLPLTNLNPGEWLNRFGAEDPLEFKERSAEDWRQMVVVWFLSVVFVFGAAGYLFLYLQSGALPEPTANQSEVLRRQAQALTEAAKRLRERENEFDRLLNLPPTAIDPSG